MSFFEVFFRAIAFLLGAALVVFLGITFANNITDMQVVTVNAETTQHLFREQQETIRFMAEQSGLTTRAAIAGTTSQVWAREMGDAARVWAVMLAVAAVGSVLAWQGGKTARHWLTERNRERAILLAFRDEFFPTAPPGAVRIERADGETMIRNYLTRQQWPLPAAQSALVERGRLTVDA